jgi:hypothetical protein
MSVLTNNESDNNEEKSGVTARSAASKTGIASAQTAMAA